MAAAGVAKLLARRAGHFRLESGHHGDLWLDLGTPVSPTRSRCSVSRSSSRAGSSATGSRRSAARSWRAPSWLCSPRTRSAVPFTYSERVEDRTVTRCSPRSYRIPRALRAELAGKRVAVVNDVVNAGSAARATLAELAGCGARPVALGSLAVLGEVGGGARGERRPRARGARGVSEAIWEPAACPLCARGVPWRLGRAVRRASRAVGLGRALRVGRARAARARRAGARVRDRGRAALHDLRVGGVRARRGGAPVPVEGRPGRRVRRRAPARSSRAPSAALLALARVARGDSRGTRGSCCRRRTARRSRSRRPRRGEVLAGCLRNASAVAARAARAAAGRSR